MKIIGNVNIKGPGRITRNDKYFDIDVLFADTDIERDLYLTSDNSIGGYNNGLIIFTLYDACINVYELYRIKEINSTLGTTEYYPPVWKKYPFLSNIQKLTDFILPEHLSGLNFNNVGSSNDIIFTLPIPKFGMNFSFTNDQYSIQVNPRSGNFINKSSIGIISNYKTSSITLVGIDNLNWVITNKSGLWINGE